MTTLEYCLKYDFVASLRTSLCFMCFMWLSVLNPKLAKNGFVEALVHETKSTAIIKLFNSTKLIYQLFSFSLKTKKSAAKAYLEPSQTTMMERFCGKLFDNLTSTLHRCWAGLFKIRLWITTTITDYNRQAVWQYIQH